MERRREAWHVYALIYGLASRQAAVALRGGVARLAMAMRGRGRAPRRLVIVPPDMRTSDASIASDIQSGYFVFAGKALSTGGQPPFALPAPSQAWAEILYGFGWLRHLRAADNDLARANARALVDAFIAAPPDPIALRSEVVARRLMSFLSQSPLILEGADHAFYLRFMRAMARDMRLLSWSLRHEPRPLRRLSVAIALSFAGLCFEGSDALGKRAARVLGRELDRQILADGGHVGRNPRTILDLLLDLLPLKQLFLARGIEPPEGLVRAVDRVPPMLRLLRHGDGTLAHFNGMGSTPVDHITTLLFYDESRGTPLQRGLLSGYERLQAGSTVITADVGALPPPPFAAEAGAGCLSFEMTSGVQRIVVNCGAPRSPYDPLGQIARASAAHSTLTLADTSFVGMLTAEDAFPHRAVARWLMGRLGPLALRGPRHVEAARPHPLTLQARHDGYAERFGIIHERRLELVAEGDRLEGEDRLLPAGARDRAAAGGDDPPARLRLSGALPATLRFHLHHSVRATLAQGGRVVMLALPSRETWQFTVAGRVAAIEESIYLSATDGARRSEQIVVTVDAAQVDTIRWRLERLTRAG